MKYAGMPYDENMTAEEYEAWRIANTRTVPIDPDAPCCWECELPFDEGRERTARVALIDPREPAYVQARLLCSHCTGDFGLAHLAEIYVYLFARGRRPRMTAGGCVHEMGDVSPLI